MSASRDPFEHCLDLPPRIGVEDVNRMLQYMTDAGGSDLFLMGNSQVFMSLHGEKIRLSKRELSDDEVVRVLKEDGIYGANAPSRLGSGKPIDTAHEFIVKAGGERKRYRYRVNAIGCQRNGRQSLTVTLRSIPTTPPRTQDISLEEEILDVCRKADQGLILVTGATGNGKSTTLAAILRDQVERAGANRNLVTIESPIEFVYDDIEKPDSFVTQLQVGRNIGSFHDGVVNAMRMAPTTILIGEARDYETVVSAVEASVTGHVAFSTVHTNSVPETLQRLVGLYPEALQTQARLDITQALRMVCTQRLVPTLDGRRTAIKEYLVFTQEVKDMLYKAENLTAATFEALRRHGRPMVEDAKEKYEAGIIAETVYERQVMNYEIAQRQAV
jgi:defect-in-organelle-trafficking protein DotB